MPRGDTKRRGLGYNIRFLVVKPRRSQHDLLQAVRRQQQAKPDPLQTGLCCICNSRDAAHREHDGARSSICSCAHPGRDRPRLESAFRFSSSHPCSARLDRRLSGQRTSMVSIMVWTLLTRTYCLKNTQHEFQEKPSTTYQSTQRLPFNTIRYKHTQETKHNHTHQDTCPSNPSRHRSTARQEILEDLRGGEKAPYRKPTHACHPPSKISGQR